MNKAVTKTSDQAVAEGPRLRPQIAANDALQRDLELRYGLAFAQWLIDRIEPARAGSE